MSVPSFDFVFDRMGGSSGGMPLRFCFYLAIEAVGLPPASIFLLLGRQ